MARSLDPAEWLDGEPPLPVRLFSVEVPPKRKLGVHWERRRRRPAGLMITEIASKEHGGFVLEHNERSKKTFPLDVVQVGDVIVRVNEAETPEGIIDMMASTCGYRTRKMFVIARIELDGGDPETLGHSHDPEDQRFSDISAR